jgi:hypothetical protein
MIPKHWQDNIEKLFKDEPEGDKVVVVLSSILDFMLTKNWRGACHESCGVLYVLLNELGLECEWRLGGVKFKDEKTTDGKAICFDHSWILLHGKIIDLAICRTNAPSFDKAPTVMDRNIENSEEPFAVYDYTSGQDDDIHAARVKATPLSSYFDKSSLHKKLGTWLFIQQISGKVMQPASIVSLRKKYNGIYWK